MASNTRAQCWCYATSFSILSFEHEGRKKKRGRTLRHAASLHRVNTLTQYIINSIPALASERSVKPAVVSAQRNFLRQDHARNFGVWCPVVFFFF